MFPVIALICFALALGVLWWHADERGSHQQRSASFAMIVVWSLSMVAYAFLDHGDRLVAYGVLAGLAAWVSVITALYRWQLLVAAGFLINGLLTIAFYSSVKFVEPSWWPLYAWALTIVGYGQMATIAVLGATGERAAPSFMVRRRIPRAVGAWARSYCEWIDKGVEANRIPS